MRWLPALAVLIATPALAGERIDVVMASDSRDTVLTYSETVIEEVDEDDGEFVTDSDDDGSADAVIARWAGVSPHREPVPAIAVAGPFRLVARDTLALVGTIDSRGPAQFAAIMARYPGVTRLLMVDCPGSVDEDANHRLARAVRAAGLITTVPHGGSVRSGAVDLFLAGRTREAAPDAEFGVHSWRDEDGREANRVPPNDPVHAGYIAYYREMGMSDADARRFYALTNSVGFENARYLSAREMAAMGLARVIK